MAYISKTQSGKFKAVVRHNGRVLKTKTFTRKGDARSWAKRIESDREAVSALGASGARIKLADLCDEYLENYSGRDQSISFKINYWRDNLGGLNLTDITIDEIMTALDAYAAGRAVRGVGRDKNSKPKLKHLGRKRSAASYNRMKAALSSMMRYAITKRYLTANPVKGVPAMTENNKRERYLSDSEREKLLNACKASEWERLRCLIVLALMTGARKGELMGLRWCDIDIQNRTATLARTKNGSPRVLTLPKAAIAELMPFREIGNGLVFGSTRVKGQPFEMKKHWYKALADAGIEGFRFHDLRHSTASYLVQAGCTLYEVGEVLGHKSIQTTARYAHLSIKHKQVITDQHLGKLTEKMS